MASTVSCLDAIRECWRFHVELSGEVNDRRNNHNPAGLPFPVINDNYRIVFALQGTWTFRFFINFLLLRVLIVFKRRVGGRVGCPFVRVQRRDRRSRSDRSDGKNRERRSFDHRLRRRRRRRLSTVVVNCVLPPFVSHGSSEIINQTVLSVIAVHVCAPCGVVIS